ncbi:MAG: hypothetical protein IT210_01825 [Armatimonadetes bacterium]|nr:hypothetical protein [Armatimonadota bacterium]
MIAYRDFVPEGSEHAPAECACMDGIVFEANQWIQENGIEVLNVQTLLLPGLEGLHPRTGHGVYYIGRVERWTQALRVWYDTP